MHLFVHMCVCMHALRNTPVHAHALSSSPTGRAAPRASAFLFSTSLQGMRACNQCFTTQHNTRTRTHTRMTGSQASHHHTPRLRPDQRAPSSLASPYASPLCPRAASRASPPCLVLPCPWRLPPCLAPHAPSWETPVASVVARPNLWPLHVHVHVCM
jgi:hypothetical protein